MYLADLDLEHPLVWTVEALLSADECRELVARVDRIGCAPAPITTAAGPVMAPDLRNNTRVMFDDPALAALLYARARTHLPPVLRGGRAVGANERLRGYRYAAGQQFAAHYDGAFVRHDHERSLLTFMVYLNHGFGGGTTDFLELGRSIEPRAGRALFFQHPLLHAGRSVDSGVKYVLRTDVMYRRD